MRRDLITMAHGSGGADTAELMRDVFAKHFNNETLGRLEDSAVIDIAGCGNRPPLSGTFHGSGDRPILFPESSPGPSLENNPCLSLESSPGPPLENNPCTPLKSSPVSPLPSGNGYACAGRLAVSTDSFVVTPLIFPGGDIGKLAVAGTVNDVLMSGATPRWLTCAFIIEAGLSIPLLDSICASMADAAAEAGVTIIAGDTKVIESRARTGEATETHESKAMAEEVSGAGESGGLMINTTGIGVFDDPGPYHCKPPAPSGIRPGDAILLTGNLGDHHAAILSARLGIKNNIKSDCALLTPVILALREAGVHARAMRDVTRGGLGTVLNELAAASGVSILLEEEKIPVNPAVRAFCGMMGLDPIYMGNEGKAVIAVAPEDAERALAAIRETEIGQNAALIGTAFGQKEDVKEPPLHTIDTKEPPLHVTNGLINPPPPTGDVKKPPARAESPIVVMRTRLGGTVRIDVLYGEGLPRIC